jgi:hypothetical protein
VWPDSAATAAKRCFENLLLAATWKRAFMPNRPAASVRRWRTDQEVMSIKIGRNPEVTGLIAGLVILGAGALMMWLPPLLAMDMMQIGFALQFGGLFLVVVGLVTAAIFGFRAKRLNAMLRGSRLLAHWVYDPVQVRDQADRELRSTKERNRAILLIVAGFFVACTLLFVVMGLLSGEGDNMPLFAGIMTAVLLIIAAFAFGMPYWQHRRALRSSGEAIIAENGLFVNGALHTWNPPLARLDEVSLVEDGRQARLVFDLSSLSRTSVTAYDAYSVEVPVPPGEEATARRVEQFFRQRNQPV